MLKLLMASAAVATVLVLSQPTKAAIIQNLGVNPTSAQGDFSSSPGGGAFEDQFTFQLVGGPLFLTIGSVTNTFASPTDFITNFQASVWNVGLDGIVNNADDVVVIGPVSAVPCLQVAGCQFAAGTAILAAGAYYLEFTGVAGGTSGYGGNLSTFAVPAPALGGGLPGLLVAIGGFLGWRRWRT
jgi:hypothetical protein